jgi:hypothetical protein
MGIRFTTQNKIGMLPQHFMVSRPFFIRTFNQSGEKQAWFFFYLICLIAFVFSIRYF